MTALKKLKVGNMVQFVRVTYEEASWSPPIGDRGMVMDITENDWVIVQFESRAGHYGFRRSELRLLPSSRNRKKPDVVTNSESSTNGRS